MNLISKKEKNYITHICHAYFYAKKYVITNGYAQEIDWQDEVNFNSINASKFISEYAWVVLSTGFSEKIVQRIYPSFSKCFYDWLDIPLVIKEKETCYNKAINTFSNKKKVQAIISTTEVIHEEGFNKFKKRIIHDGISYLENLPFIGSVTKYHLAKNIGLNYSKPDRHLKRVSSALGFESVHSLCNTIALNTCEKESVIDLVIWRYATLNSDYLSLLNTYIQKEYKVF